MKHNRPIRAARCPAFQVGYLAIALALCLYFFGCDDDPPTGPVDPTPKDYVVYFWDLTSDLDYFGYHPLTGQIDSFTVPYYAWYGITASADGELLYVATSTEVAVIDLGSLETVSALPYAAPNGVYVSPDGQYVALAGGGIRVLRTADHGMVYEDTSFAYVGSCYFSADGNRMYCRGGGPGTVLTIDIAAGVSTQRELTADAMIYAVIPSPDESRLYLYTSGRYANYFEVYDVSSDSILFRDELLLGRGCMLLTPDGKHVIYTQPGDYTTMTGPSYFTIFDTERNRIRMLVSTVGCEDGLNPGYMPLQELSITPDGNWLVASYALGGSSMIGFNMKTLEIDRYVELEDDNIGSLTCQVAP